MKRKPAEDPATAQRGAERSNKPVYNQRQARRVEAYEHAAEELALKRLLEGKHFRHALDIGGGYGRLSKLLAGYADHVTLLDPSQDQLDRARDYLRDTAVTRRHARATDLQDAEGSVDLVVLVRVLRHLPDPIPALREISRVLSNDGYAIIEVANYANVKNRLKYALRRDGLPHEPVELRSEPPQNLRELPFVSHNPHTVMKQLAHAGLKVDRILSVSNLRNTGLEKIMPKQVLLAIEGILQPTLASSFFGPTVFFMVRKGN